jgi:hypothetical protein
MLRWSQMWRWHFRYTATIELTHNPAGTEGDAKLLGNELERKIREIRLDDGYRVAGVKVEFIKEENDVHLEDEGKGGRGEQAR